MHELSIFDISVALGCSLSLNRALNTMLPPYEACRSPYSTMEILNWRRNTRWFGDHINKYKSRRLHDVLLHPPYHSTDPSFNGRWSIRWPASVGSGSCPARTLICKDWWTSFGCASVASRSFRRATKSSSSIPSFRCLFCSLCCLTLIQATGALRSSGG